MSGETQLLVGFFVNLLFAFIIIRGIYSPKKPNQEFIFTFLVFNSVIYVVMTLFTSIQLSVGVGFGLFALFSILRYRTQSIPIREMTYLFVMVAMPLVNAFFFESGQYTDLIIANILIIGIIWALERTFGFYYEESKNIIYEKIELTHENRRTEMITDLTSRTGLPLNHVEVHTINYLTNSAEITIYYPIKQKARRFHLFQK